jgi:hypothetical protein
MAIELLRRRFNFAWFGGQPCDRFAYNLVALFLGKLLANDLLSQVDCDVGAGDGKVLHGGVAGAPDLANCPGQFILRGLVAFGFDGAARVLGVAASLFQERADLACGGSQPGFVLGQEPLRILVPGFGGGNVVGDLALTFLKRLGNLWPGELLEDEEQQDEHDQRPNCQIGAELQRIRAAGFIVGRFGSRLVRHLACGLLVARFGGLRRVRQAP